MYQLLAQGIHSLGAAKLFADTDNTMISDSTMIAPYRLHMAHQLQKCAFASFKLHVAPILWDPAFLAFTLSIAYLFETFFY